MVDKRKVLVARRDNFAFNITEERGDKVRLTNIDTGRSHWVSKVNLGHNYTPSTREDLKEPRKQRKKRPVSESTELKRRLEKEFGDGQVIAKRDGTFVVKQGFFYRHGFSAEDLGNKVQKVVPRAQILSEDENWNPWPRDSWWEVRFRLPKEK